MQRRGGWCGSSGRELGVFRATRYFHGPADLAAGPVTVTVTVREPEVGTMVQAKAAHDMGESCRSIKEPGVGCFCSLAASFRMNHPPASRAGTTTATTASGSHDEPPKLVSSSSSRDTVTAAAAVDGRDLGEVVGDRRLQGVRAVRGGGGGGEERWVVIMRCGGHAYLEEEHHVHHKIVVDAASSGDHPAVGRAEDGDDPGSDSDTSSNLFELDLGDGSDGDTSSNLFELDLGAR